MTISHRDFPNGVTLIIIVGLTPAETLRVALGGRYYPPALTDLHGSHPGAFEVAHRMGWEGKTLDIDHSPIEEGCGLMVVSDGISGLAAVWFYRERHPAAHILIIENHDNFSGHARRNEFQAGGRAVFDYGDSESL